MRTWRASIRVSEESFSRFFGTSDESPDPETAAAIVENIAVENGMVAGFFKVEGSTITAEFHEGPNTKAVITNAAFPLVIFAVVVGSIFMGGLAFWSWEIVTDSIVEITDSATRLVGQPLVKAGALAVFGYIVVDLFKKAS